jgi:uncharacterized membrane protein YdjX (TVP38/TMEM64 family)
MAKSTKDPGFPSACGSPNPLRGPDSGKKIKPTEARLANSDATRSAKFADAARRLPLALAVATAIAFIALGGRHYVTLPVLAANAQWLRDLVDRWEILAAILFIVADAAALMVLVIPSWFCTTVAGLLFGPWFGTAYALAGTTLGAVGVFLAARAGLSGITKRGGPLVGSIATRFRTNAFVYLIGLRLLPFFPFTLVNIAAALGGMQLSSYALGTLLGIIPSVFIYASLGHLLIDLSRQGSLPEANLSLQPKFLIPLVGLTVLALLPVLVRRYWRC